MGHTSNQVREQASSSIVYSMQSKYQTSRSSESEQSKPPLHSGSQQSSYRPPNPTHHYFQQSRPPSGPLPLSSRPSADAKQPQNNSWKFTNSFGSQTSTFDGKGSLSQPKTVQLTQSQVGNTYGKYMIYDDDDDGDDFKIYTFFTVFVVMQYLHLFLEGNISNETSHWELTEDPDFSYWWYETLEPV